MNTDNLSILGLTIDYGPYGWLEDYDPDWTPNTTDREGKRYRYGWQPPIAQWNLTQLANALVPAVGAPEPLQEALRRCVLHVAMGKEAVHGVGLEVVGENGRDRLGHQSLTLEGRHE